MEIHVSNVLGDVSAGKNLLLTPGLRLATAIRGKTRAFCAFIEIELKPERYLCRYYEMCVQRNKVVKRKFIAEKESDSCSSS